LTRKRSEVQILQRPLAKALVTGPFLLIGFRQIGGLGPEVDEKLTRRAGHELNPSDLASGRPRSRAQATAQRPPKHLSASARRLWRETVEGYELERHHLEFLERACRALDHAIEAEEIIQRDA
jgi:hypothetical protein